MITPRILAGWSARGVALLLAGCATINEAPVVELSTERSPSTQRGVLGEHVVMAGETMYGIAFRHGLDYRALAVWNAIDAPFTIRPGLRLRLDAPAPPQDPAPRQAGRETAVDSTLQAGEVRTYALGTALDAGSALAVESIDSGSSTHAAELAATSSNPTHAAVPPAATPPWSEPVPLAQVPTRSAATPTSAPAGPLSAAVVGDSARGSSAPPLASAPALTTIPAAAAVAPNVLTTAPSQSVGGVTWRWPAQGQVVSRFAPGDPARQGIDVQGHEGAPVVAAAGGEVVYSGNGLVGYGELVIIKHSSEFLSAYGHNRKRLVAEGTSVAAGQQIAEMGKANGTQHVLHFEIRRAGKPVDPLSILPRR